MKKIPSLTFSAVALLIIALLIALPSITTSSRSAALAVEEDELDKEAMHARMKELQTEIANLWKQYNQSQDQEVRARIDEAQQEFDSISSSLGGDRPVAEGEEETEQAFHLQLSPQVAAVSPVGCPTVTSTFSASPAARIPASGTSGSRTFTITVSGIGTSIWDVDALTSITHTACADLDITLTSPSGTIVTLTTDNGGSLDNVFNGTLWDDQANPGGQVPYSSNNGVASDHAYSNNTLASPLAPEEAMGAFIGEDPNGVWTLKITDDSLFDIGNLASWSLNITTLGAGTFTTQAVFPSMDANLPAVLANGCTPGELGGPVTSTVSVAGLGNHTSRVLLRTEITHLNPDDLDITLTSPSGTVVTLTTDNGPLPLLANGAFDGTNWFDRANLGTQVPYPTCLLIFPCNQELATDRIYSGNGTAASLAPEEAMSAFNGENPNGVWTLKVVDDSCNLSIGSLKAWSLDLTTATCCSITCPSNIVQGNTPGQCGANVSFSPTDNGMCSTVSCVPASGSFFPVGTTTVTCTTAAGPGCMFTVTVNDLEPPQISCAPIIATGLITSGGCTTVTFPSPPATDNCGSATVVCTPPSGSCFPLGVTTINCVATDAAGNSSSTAVSCPSGGGTIVVQVFDCRLQDDTRPSRAVVFNSITGDYQFCCDGVTLTGRATKITRKGMDIQLEDNRLDRRVLIKVSKATFRGSAAATLLVPPNFQCQIEDRDTRNDTTICSITPP
jgi:subtilisin-like proprotein convertase family protein